MRTCKFSLSTVEWMQFFLICYFQKHFILYRINDSTYLHRLCQEDEESSYHVIAECPAMQYFRREIFQNPTSLPDTPVWSVMQVSKFLRESPVGNMLDSME